MNANLKEAVELYLKTNRNNDRQVMVLTYPDRMVLQAADISRYPSTLLAGNSEDDLADNIRQYLTS